jgi:hypothetical protein
VQDVTVVERPLPGGTPGRTNERLVRFVVRRTWKGVAGPIVEISTGMGGGDCGVDFAIGREYIVDAQNRDGRLVTGICDFRSESNAV